MPDSSEPLLSSPKYAPPHLVIIGAGAAGCFAAIQAKAVAPHARVTILEAGNKPLAKVRISGGGRCNVTHGCFDRSALVAAYPRGGKALHGLFARFGPQETIDWFTAHGVALKTEDDGRMFPTTDDSATIVSCLLDTLRRAGVGLLCRQPVTDLTRQPDGRFALTLFNTEEPVLADAVLIAAGSAPRVADWLEDFAQPWVAQAPSLFTFCVEDARLADLAGVSVPHAVGRLTIPGQKKPLEQSGPLLITHWGVSGPVVLRLSAWGAYALQEAKYKMPVTFDLCPDTSIEELLTQWQARKLDAPRQFMATYCPVEGLPKRLWQRFLEHAGIGPEMKWADVGGKALRQVAESIKQLRLEITGKGVFKEEFVTAGGVALAGVDMRTMESKTVPGLYFAGEVLDIDGITGGFNFQAAWATGFVAGSAMTQQVTQIQVASAPGGSRQCSSQQE